MNADAVREGAELFHERDQARDNDAVGGLQHAATLLALDQLMPRPRQSSLVPRPRRKRRHLPYHKHHGIGVGVRLHRELHEEMREVIVTVPDIPGGGGAAGRPCQYRSP